MKAKISIILVVALILTTLFTGCGTKEEVSDNTKVDNEEAQVSDDTVKDDDADDMEDEEEPLKIVLMINGTLGDLSFFDSSKHGIEMVKETYGDLVEVKIVEASADDTKWEPTLIDLSTQDWDIIIVGTWNMVEPLERIAQEFPDKKYIIFDSAVNYDAGELDNVYSIVYKQNEGAFLAGALAANITSSDLEMANEEKKIGFLGGMDIPVINDFLVGYIEGAQYVDPEVKVDISYIGSFDDSAKGKELALVQFNQGVDIGFNVAGAAGLGQLDAAKELNKYAIGVDADQALQFKDTDPLKAIHIVTSVLKRVDNSLFRAINMHLEGTLPYGEAEVLGFAENAVGLAENEFYFSIVSDELQEKVNEIRTSISSGDISVGTAFGMETDELNVLRDSVK